jgi:hypothetical protein
MGSGEASDTRLLKSSLLAKMLAAGIAGEGEISVADRLASYSWPSAN